MVPQALLSFNLFGQEFSVHLYGIMIAIGIICCLVVFFIYTKKVGMQEEVQDFAFFCAIVAIALGFLFAKLYQAFYNFIETGSFDFYSAGITAMGGFIGGAITYIFTYFLIGKLYFKSRPKINYKSQFNTIFRVAPMCITIAHAFGRIGCLFAGCCHGAYVGNTYSFGLVPRYYLSGNLIGYYIPTQAYESLFLFALFTVLSILYFRRSNITMHIYLIAYGIWRFVIEFFRDDEAGAIVLGLRPSQWQSFIFILVGIILFVIYKMKKYPMTLPLEKKQ